ncbi:hypothetical protein [Mangrovicella endophytica]|uniref:hypothetical protein n=1 Tax=Mangrovicella endophytica TaxID=2066697 RepID=UPI0012FFE5C2|nr:hypothetical protein [Mangrovicella endophytica]
MTSARTPARTLRHRFPAKPRSLGRLAIVAVLLPLAGCVTGGREALVPTSEGVTALGDGLLGSAGVKLTGEARAKSLEAEYQALQFGPVGQPVPWDEGGYHGEVVPTQLYRVGTQDCRGYSHTLTRSGKTVKNSGTACKTGDGVWMPIT